MPSFPARQRDAKYAEGMALCKRAAREETGRTKVPALHKHKSTTQRHKQKSTTEKHNAKTGMGKMPAFPAKQPGRKICERDGAKLNGAESP